MNRELKNKLTIYNNRIKDNMIKAYNTKMVTSPLTFTNYYSYSNRQYDRIKEAVGKYLLENYEQIYFDERWKQIIIAKRLNRRLRGIDFNKERDTYNVTQYVKGVIGDVNNAVDNGKKERYLNLRLIEMRNKQNKIHAFLTEDEIQNIIQEAETYPDVRNILIDELLQYSDDGKTVVVDTKSGGSRHYDIKYYAEMVLRTSLREIQTMGTIDAANEVGTSLVEFSVHNTDCIQCAPFEGKIYSIDGKNSLFPPLDETPPIHPNPYDKKTKVLTKNKGWIFVKDVKINDICLSLNKDTNEIEYIKVTKLFKFKRDKMIRFKSNYVDMIVSKEHQMLVTSTNKKIKKLINAETLLNNNHSYFISSSIEGSKGFDDRFYYFPLSNIKRQVIDYNDYAYCVELEKNHVLYVSRNGKCMWSGNCLHSLTVVFESVLHNRGNIDDYINFSWGRLDKHPTARGWIPLSQRELS